MKPLLKSTFKDQNGKDLKLNEDHHALCIFSKLCQHIRLRPAEETSEVCGKTRDIAIAIIVLMVGPSLLYLIGVDRIGDCLEDTEDQFQSKT